MACDPVEFLFSHIGYIVVVLELVLVMTVSFLFNGDCCETFWSPGQRSGSQ